MKIIKLETGIVCNLGDISIGKSNESVEGILHFYTTSGNSPVRYTNVHKLLKALQSIQHDTNKSKSTPKLFVGDNVDIRYRVQPFKVVLKFNFETRYGKNIQTTKLYKKEYKMLIAFLKQCILHEKEQQLLRTVGL